MKRSKKRTVLLVGLWAALATIACSPSPGLEPEAPEAESSAPAPPPPPPAALPAGAVAADPAQMRPSEGAEAPAATSAEVRADASPPPQDQWTAVHPSGQWVYANGYGWMWIPNESHQVIVEETPYVYLYTPAYGWTWYVSPWGPGPYRYGVWVVHPWRPVGWRYGWVARPRVVVHLHDHGHAHPMRGPRRGRGRRH